VDRTAPIASITSAPPTPTNVTTASFTFTSNDPTATFQCRLDGAAFAPCVSPKDYSGLTNGNHTFRVRAIDLAGNVGATALHTWNVDTTPPNTTITGNPGAVTTSTSATFTFTASQAGSVFDCSLDGAGFTACTSPSTYTGLVAGSHSFRVRATDPAGNSDPTPAVFGWTIQ
jgi:large repetitive protein